MRRRRRRGPVARRRAPPSRSGRWPGRRRIRTAARAGWGRSGGRPMWVISQTSVALAASSTASGRPSRAQQRSRLPLVHTKARGSPSYGLHRAGAVGAPGGEAGGAHGAKGRWVASGSARTSPAPRAAKSSASSADGSLTSVVRIHDRPGRVCGEHPLPRREAAVGVPPGPSDQGDADTGALRRTLQRATDLGVEVAGGEGLRAPGAGLLDQEPGAGSGGGTREGLGQLPRTGRTGAHAGEPNLSCGRARAVRAFVAHSVSNDDAASGDRWRGEGDAIGSAVWGTGGR